MRLTLLGIACVDLFLAIPPRYLTYLCAQVLDEQARLGCVAAAGQAYGMNGRQTGYGGGVILLREQGHQLA